MILQIAKWCFGAVFVWYGLTCLYTLHDTEVWINDGEYTLWGIRYWLMNASGILFVFCQLFEDLTHDRD